MIQEMTFPNGQNTLYVKFECNAGCDAESKWTDDVRIKSPMLKFITIPEEVMKYYSQAYKCFEIKSDKLNETFYLYMPTIGTVERLRARITESRKLGRKPDKAFISIAPYLIQDWHNLSQESYADLSNETFGWQINKFTFVKKFTEMIEASRYSMSKMRK
jgi:hypothetical protein